MSSIRPELARLQQCITALTAVRVTFGRMEDDGERARSWNYLRSRFSEFEKAEMPNWEDE